jgi:hypothetical protein
MTNTKQNASEAVGLGKAKQKGSEECVTTPVRIKLRTRSKLDNLLRQANKDRIGRRVRVDDLLWFSLGLITDQHLAEISANTMSNKDRLEMLYRRLSKERRGLSKEQFFGMLLDGSLSK